MRQMCLVLIAGQSDHRFMPVDLRRGQTTGSVSERYPLSSMDFPIRSVLVFLFILEPSA